MKYKSAQESMGIKSEIHDIYSISEVKHYLPADEKVLLLLDIDDTLIMPKDPHAHYQNIQRHKDHYDQIFEGLSKEERHILVMHVIVNGGSIVIEENILEELEHLRNSDHLVMAFTAAPRHRKGDGEWRHKDLKELEIDFTSDANSIAPASEQYHLGILFTDHNPKGPALAQFLEDAHISPSTIVFVDDSQTFLQSVREEMARLKINFIGLWYHGAKKHPSQEVSEEEFLAHFLELRKIIET